MVPPLWVRIHATRKRCIPVVKAVIICLDHHVNHVHLGVIAAAAALYVAVNPKHAPVAGLVHMILVMIVLVSLVVTKLARKVVLAERVARQTHLAVGTPVIQHLEHKIMAVLHAVHQRKYVQYLRGRVIRGIINQAILVIARQSAMRYQMTKPILVRYIAINQVVLPMHRVRIRTRPAPEPHIALVIIHRVDVILQATIVLGAGHGLLAVVLVPLA